jgi:hypothetical protein
MLPEPTPVTPPKRAAAAARPRLEVMTPLFSMPGGTEPEIGPGAGRRPRAAARKDPADLLAVTAERLRRALARSFLRYGIAGDLEAAIHAAMNVVEPVLEARDTEIVRLRRLMAARAPGRAAAKVPAPPRRRVSAKVPRELSG